MNIVIVLPRGWMYLGCDSEPCLPSTRVPGVRGWEQYWVMKCSAPDGLLPSEPYWTTLVARPDAVSQDSSLALVSTRHYKWWCVCGILMITDDSRHWSIILERVPIAKSHTHTHAHKQTHIDSHRQMCHHCELIRLYYHPRCLAFCVSWHSCSRYWVDYGHEDWRDMLSLLHPLVSELLCLCLYVRARARVYEPHRLLIYIRSSNIYYKLLKIIRQILLYYALIIIATALI